jgi:hypothetical protein
MSKLYGSLRSRIEGLFRFDPEHASRLSESMQGLLDLHLDHRGRQ